MSSLENAHNFSGYLPVLKFGESFELPTYFLVVSASFCICLLWLVRRAEKRKLSRSIALDLSILLMSGGFIGARLFHVAFEAPQYYWHYRQEPIRILEFWRGGFVWFGGAISGAALGLFYLSRRRIPAGVWLDVFAPVAALGYGLGRLACLLAGCCYGSVCILESGFQFRYPTQAFAVVWELSILVLLLQLEMKRDKSRFQSSKFNSKKSPLRTFEKWLSSPGRLFLLWVVLHSIGRIIMESFRGDPRGPDFINLSVSTWISFFILSVCGSLGFRDYLRSRNL